MTARNPTGGPLGGSGHGPGRVKTFTDYTVVPRLNRDGCAMAGCIDGIDRGQETMFPARKHNGEVMVPTKSTCR